MAGVSSISSGRVEKSSENPPDITFSRIDLSSIPVGRDSDVYHAMITPFWSLHYNWKLLRRTSERWKRKYLGEGEARSLDGLAPCSLSVREDLLCRLIEPVSPTDPPPDVTALEN